MHWIDALLLVGIIAGVACGVFLVARSPTFWAAVGATILADAFPYIRDYVGKRNSPKVEEKMHDAVRRAQEWDNFNKRPKDK
jgi:hypothetical protein